MPTKRTTHRTSRGKDLYVTKDGQKVHIYKAADKPARRARRFAFNKGHNKDIATELEAHAQRFATGHVLDGNTWENGVFWMRAGAKEIKRLQTYIQLKELEEWQK